MAYEEFQELINNKKNNLEYLEQFKETYESIETEEWNNFKTVLGEELSIGTDFINDLNFDNLITAIGSVALLKPGVFGEIMKKEVEELESFFTAEYDRIDSVYTYLSEIVSKLSGDWSDLTTFDDDTRRTALNNLMNDDIPRAGRELKKYIRNLVILENNIVDHDTTVSEIGEIENSLINTKNNLNAATSTNVISQLNELLSTWDNIKAEIEGTRHPKQAEFKNAEEKYNKVGNNFINSVNNFLGLFKTIRTAIVSLNNVEDNIYESWEGSIEHILKNTKDYSYAPNLKKAIDNYIDYNTESKINTGFPVVSKTINQESIEKWEEESGEVKNKIDLWVSLMDNSINILSEISGATEPDVTTYYDDFYSNISETIINSYKEITTQYWDDLINGINQMTAYLNLITLGKATGENLEDDMIDLLTYTDNILSEINTVKTYFADNDPIGEIETEYGLNSQTASIINSFITSADFLGKDYLSEKISEADIGSVVNMDKETSIKNNYIYKELQQTENNLIQENLAKMKKIVSNNRQRQNKLKEGFSNLIEKGIENNQAEIEEMQDINDKIKGVDVNGL